MIHLRLQLERDVTEVGRFCLQEFLFGIILLKHEGMAQGSFVE